MRRNKRGEELSAATLKAYLEKHVREAGGVTTHRSLAEAVARDFKAVLGPSDKRLLRGRPKWMNTLDFAKVLARKLKPRILCRARQEKGERIVYIVRCARPTPKKWIDWVRERDTKQSFKKRCAKCRRRNLMGARACVKCGTPFPVPSSRREVRLGDLEGA